MPTDAPAVFDLRKHAAVEPQRTALVCGEERLSYGDLEALSNRVAAVFRSVGLARGDHVASLIGNRPESLAVAWAAWRSGLYLTPMSTALTPTELHYLVEDSDAKLVIADATLGAVAERLAEMTGRRITWLSLRGFVPGFTPLEPLLAQASPTAHAHEPPGGLMMYTSGTTGTPKGVLRPLLPADWHGTPTFAADLITLFDLSGEDVRYLSTAPLYHAAPLRFALAVTAAGGTVHVMEKFDAEEALRLMETSDITHSQWVPAMFQRMLALPAERRAMFNAPKHRIAIHGAAPCTPALKQAMIGWWGPILIEYYSGSEGVGLTMIDSFEAVQRPGSVGRARKGTLHIADESGVEHPVGMTGLVCFSGVTPFEYHKAPEKTAARKLPHGWQSFGDIGHVDDDGYLYLTDRQDDMIISGGVNIYPQEIETVIRETPGVWDCAVVGVPDELFGERPVAFIVPDRGSSGKAVDLMEAIDHLCGQHLSRLKRPASVQIIEALPRSLTGKLLRRQLRELCVTSRQSVEQ